MNKDTVIRSPGLLVTDFFKARHRMNSIQSNDENHSPDVEVVSDLSRIEQFNLSLEDQIKSSFPDYIIRVLGLKNMLNFSPITIHMKYTSDENDFEEIVLHTDDLTTHSQFDWDLQNRPYVFFNICDPVSGDAGVLTLTCQQNNEWSYCWAKRPCIFSPFGYKDNNITLANSLIDPKVSLAEKERILRSLVLHAEKTHYAPHTSSKMF